MYLSQDAAFASPALTTVSSLSLIAGYWQVAWLLFGTYEVATSQSVAQRTRYIVLAFLAVVAVISVLASLPAASPAPFLVRVGLRSFGMAVAFLVASYGCGAPATRRSRSASDSAWSPGRSCSTPLQHAHYLVLFLSPSLLAVNPLHAVYAAPLDFLLQFIIGVGMVIWLLEEERRQVLTASARAEHLAYHDPLTDLPNRNLLIQHLSTALHRAERRQDGRVAVLFLDLDRFKVINDSLGHNFGDEILKSITERLRRNLLETETVARLGGDGFAVLLPVISSEWKIAQVAEKILGLIRRPFAIQGRELYVTTSVGISRFPEDGLDPDELIKKAEIAMYQAKEQGGDQFQVYAPTMDSNALERLALESDLRKALTHGELVLFYQPVLDARSGRIEGVEALLRWQHPERGLMGPAEFLWLAEVTGMSNAVDLWVLRTACREIAGWHADGARLAGGGQPLGPPVPAPRPGGPHQGGAGRERPAGLARSSSRSPRPWPCRTPRSTQGVLRGLKELGIQIAIDDFGTGYSSLSYLTTLAIDIAQGRPLVRPRLGGDRGSKRDHGARSSPSPTAWRSRWWPRASSTRRSSRSCAARDATRSRAISSARRSPPASAAPWPSKGTCPFPN